MECLRRPAISPAWLSTSIQAVPQKGNYGVAHVCRDPDKRAVVDDRPNRAETTLLPPSITVAAHNAPYARHTTRSHLVGIPVTLRSKFPALGARTSTMTARSPARLRIPPSASEGRSLFSRVAGPLTTAAGGHRRLPLCHHVWPDKAGSKRT